MASFKQSTVFTEEMTRDVKTYRKTNGPRPELPADVKLSTIERSLPKEVFETSRWEATKAIIITLCATTLGLYLVHISPWYLLPAAWFFAGTCATGFFVIAHDAAHRSLLKSVLACDIIGNICMMPLVYPYEPWRLQHNIHHKYTDLLVVDNAWQPFQPEDYTEASGLWKFIFRIIKGPMWWFASVGHQITKHYPMSNFEEAERPRCRFSVNLCVLFMITAWPAIFYYTGVWGFITYWLMPWLGFHFWMSTFTMVHHTAPDIPFLSKERWNPAVAQLMGTVHCEYPWWVTFLCHNINVHIPHHVCTRIPMYRLWKAHAALKEKWGQYMIESTFGYAMIKDIITKCHIYDERKAYMTFDELVRRGGLKKSKEQ